MSWQEYAFKRKKISRCLTEFNSARETMTEGERLREKHPVTSSAAVGGTTWTL